MPVATPTLCLLAAAASALAQAVPVDLSGYSDACGVVIRREGDRLTADWPAEAGARGRLAIHPAPGKPLLEHLGTATGPDAPTEPILAGVEPTVWVTVGTRAVPPGRPAEMSVWNVFFDKPAKRPFQTHVSKPDRKRVRVTSTGRRATIAVGELTAGSFTGELAITLYAGSSLVHVEAVLSTKEDRRAILYDAGLMGEGIAGRFAWMDVEGRMQRAAAAPAAADTPVAVRHRMMILETEGGSAACFPPPHQYQFPRDWTDNLKFAWYGSGHGGAGGLGFGVRQAPDGGRAFEPWFNAPPDTQQRMGVFFLLTRGRAEEALRQALRYTHDDRFVPLPGHITFTSHYHMAVAVAAMARKFQGTPDFVRVFQEMGVQAVHLGDFHGDGHQKDPGPLRLPELEALFRECRRLSDAKLLLIPGEEVNDFLGVKQPGKHPGHWMSLFPRPVYWTMQRGPGKPLVQEHPTYGRVYNVGSREDMMELIVREGALVWAAHPRIKASSWTPDIFRNEIYFVSDYWLGGAWKAMPADLSRPRLGERVLDLLDDMANWGRRKYAPGEVDVFKIDRTHELYGHMNVNYLKLDRLPRFDDGWKPILDALGAGRFFVSTGELLIREFTVGGKEAGQALALPADGRVELKVDLEWTFPPAFALVISGDGGKVYRERIDLSDAGPFGRRTLMLKPDLSGRKWVRLEAWDVAVNGAYTQPVWLTGR